MGLFDWFFKGTKTVGVEIGADFDECCENCGELLEDCECDHKGHSKREISQEIDCLDGMDDLEFDEMMDILEDDEID